MVSINPADGRDRAGLVPTGLNRCKQRTTGICPKFWYVHCVRYCHTTCIKSDTSEGEHRAKPVSFASVLACFLCMILRCSNYIALNASVPVTFRPGASVMSCPLVAGGVPLCHIESSGVPWGVTVPEIFIKVI